MSMTITAFLQEARIPTKTQLEAEIEKLGYNFKFIEDFDKLDQFSGVCELDGIKTFVELFGEEKEVILQDFQLTNEYLIDYDYALSFIEGSDYIQGACVGIILIVLIDICDSKVIYQDDQIWYTREMLIDMIPRYINNGKKNPKPFEYKNPLPQENKKKNKHFTDWILWSLLFVSVVLMKQETISWPIPLILLILVVVNSVIEHRKKSHS